MYRHKGILHSDLGVVQTVNGPAPGNADKHQGWARDSEGRGYVVTSGATSYRHQGKSYTVDGSLLVVAATPGASGDYGHGGNKIRSDGYTYQSTITV